MAKPHEVAILAKWLQVVRKAVSAPSLAQMKGEKRRGYCGIHETAFPIRILVRSRQLTSNPAEVCPTTKIALKDEEEWMDSTITPVRLRCLSKVWHRRYRVLYVPDVSASGF